MKKIIYQAVEKVDSLKDCKFCSPFCFAKGGNFVKEIPIWEKRNKSLMLNVV